MTLEASASPALRSLSLQPTSRTCSPAPREHFVSTEISFQEQKSFNPVSRTGRYALEGRSFWSSSVVGTQTQISCS